MVANRFKPDLIRPLPFHSMCCEIERFITFTVIISSESSSYCKAAGSVLVCVSLQAGRTTKAQ